MLFFFFLKDKNHDNESYGWMLVLKKCRYWQVMACFLNIRLYLRSEMAYNNSLLTLGQLISLSFHFLDRVQAYEFILVLNV